MIYDPHSYQVRAISYILDHPKASLWLDMGLGKSSVTLTAIRRMQDQLEIGRVLVIAPLSVAQNTWSAECAKWDHLMDTRISLVLGDARTRVRNLWAPADIYVTNRENTEWLCKEIPDLHDMFDMIVIDESTSFKSHSAKRFKALRKASSRVPRMVLLTGTPSPNGYEDLWSQFALLDGGERLGLTWTGFLGRFFHPLWGNGRVTYKYGINQGAAEEIQRRISDITLTMRAADYLSLPDAMVIDQTLAFSSKDRHLYETFRRDYLTEIDGTEITAQTAVALATKLHQVTSGAVYDDCHMALECNTAKMDALVDLVESAQAGGENVVIYYQYQHELPRLQAALKAWKPVFFNGQPDVLAKWNKGEISVLLAHPASVSYGLNIQQGGHIIIWYSLTYNLEQYQQANARLHRQGQKAPVRIYRMIVAGTIDEVISRALSGKTNVQDALLDNLKQMKQDETN